MKTYSVTEIKDPPRIQPAPGRRRKPLPYLVASEDEVIGLFVNFNRATNYARQANKSQRSIYAKTKA